MLTRQTNVVTIANVKPDSRHNMLHREMSKTDAMTYRETLKNYMILEVTN